MTSIAIAWIMQFEFLMYTIKLDKTMKAKVLFFVIVICLAIITHPVVAQMQITKTEARKVATNALEMFDMNKGNYVSDKTIDTLFTMKKNGHTLMYEVKFNSGERVILSGHRGCFPILGIVTSMNNDVETAFSDSELLPDAFRLFIDEYANQIQYCFDNQLDGMCDSRWESLKQNYNTKSENYVFIPPLLTTKWGQDMSNDSIDPVAYNANTPSGPYCAHCYAGCSAVAMAQIVKFWAFPNEIPYNCESYYYNLMPDELRMESNSNYESQKKKVAGLIYDCGVAMNMNYCSNTEATSAPNSCASSTFFLQQIVEAFKSYGYSNVVPDSESENGTHEAWVNKVALQLFDQKPIYYEAFRYDPIQGKRKGHAFVCDGYYRENDVKLFHMNWGWNGEPDAWYALDNLNPSHTYNLNHRGVFDIYPTDCWENIIMQCNRIFAVNVSKYYSAQNRFSNNYHNYVINSGASVHLQAGEEILLTDGFYAAEGSEFTAIIAPCGSSRGEGDYLSELSDERVQQEIECNNQTSSSVSPLGMVIFPNPVTGSFSIQIGNPSDKVTFVEVFNIMGGMVLKDDNAHDNIDVSVLHKGMYVVRVKCSSGIVYYGKFVKE